MSRKKDRAAPQDGLHDEDRVVTAAELAAAHDIDRKARALAVQGLPAAGDTEPPLPERELMEVPQNSLAITGASGRAASASTRQT